MSLDDDLSACAGLVARGDARRYRATMAAPVPLRRILFPIYAFNLEVARAPWLTRESLIAQMRLQWWRDALAEIGAGGTVRRHEVVSPLAAVLDDRATRDLDALIEARGADMDGLQVASAADLTRYLDATAGTLLWTASRLAGFADEAAARDGGLAQGIVGWLRAGPDLIAKGRPHLPPGDAENEARSLAEKGRIALGRFRQAKPSRAVAPVFLALAGTGADLDALVRDPTVRPDEDGVTSRIRLWRARIFGRV